MNTEKKERKKAMNTEQVKSLIKTRNNEVFLEKFDNTKFGKDITTLWVEIATACNDGFTGEECRIKYNNLRKKFWEEKDRMKKTGESGSDWKHWNVMLENCIKGRNNEPEFVLDTDSPLVSNECTFMSTSPAKSIIRDYDTNSKNKGEVKDKKNKKRGIDEIYNAFEENSNKRIELLQNLVESKGGNNKKLEKKVAGLEKKIESLHDENSSIQKKLDLLLKMFENKNK